MIIYHNPRCSKSRDALELLKKNKCKVEVREYLKEAPSVMELKELLQKLGCKAIDLVRKSEPLFVEGYSAKKLTNLQWITVLSKNPILIERPIVIDGERAVIGRPVERVIELVQVHKKK